MTVASVSERRQVRRQVNQDGRDNGQSME